MNRSAFDDIDRLRAENERLDAQNDRYARAMHQIETWAEAYPLAVFPEPDFVKAHEALKSVGLTLDAVSASAMRHVITKVREIARAALKEPT